MIFDPAGTWHHPRLPERNDVHFGMSDKMIAFYVDYHARATFSVIEQQTRRNGRAVRSATTDRFRDAIHGRLTVRKEMVTGPEWSGLDVAVDVADDAQFRPAKD